MTRPSVILMSLAAALTGCGHASKPELSAAAAASAPTSSSSARTTKALTLTYLGVAGWELDDGVHTLLIDPYFSRPNARNSTNLLTPDDAAIARHAPSAADLILVTHSHYDHALDVATIAKRTHATVAGTDSTLNLARAEGVPEDELVHAAPHGAIAGGPFFVQVFRSLHSLTGQAYAEIPQDAKLPMNADGYGEGGTLQYLMTTEGRSIFFVGSANFVEEEIAGLHPDVAVVATGLREKIPDYTCRMMHALGNPKLVIANHFDAFWKSLEEDTTTAPETAADLAKFADEVHGCSPVTQVVVPAHFQRFEL